MGKIKNLEAKVQGSIQAFCWVEPADAVAARMKASLGGSDAAARQAGRQTNTALAVTPEALWLVPLRLGVLTPVAMDGGRAIPRNEVRSIELGTGFANVPVTITKTDGETIVFNVHKTRRKGVESVRSALGL